jgi:TM2 domain-containing membrane protein YozV
VPYCRECGSQAAHTASYCSSCGTSIVLPRDFEPHSHRNRFVAATLAVVFGFFGVHHIYLGSYKRAALYMLFSWPFVPLFLGLYDAYRYVRVGEAEFHRRFVVREVEGDDDTEGTGDDEARREGGGVEASDETTGEETVQETAASTGPPVREETSTHDVEANDVASASTGTSPETETSEEPFLMRAVGTDGALILYGDRIHIQRKGLDGVFTRGVRGGKTILLEEVTSVEFKEPRTLAPGHIDIGQPGYNRPRGVSENEVSFTSKQQPEFERIRDAIRTIRGDEDQALESLRKLYASGLIAEEEYRERKRVLEGE